MENTSETRFRNVYGKYRPQRAYKIKVFWMKDANVFKAFDPKKILKNNKPHLIIYNQKTRDWQCTCSFGSLQAIADHERWGYCAHILALLLNKSRTKFEEEIRRKTHLPPRK